MSASDEDRDLPRTPARSWVQELRPDSATLGKRLLRLGTKTGAKLDVADILDLYFHLFDEVDPDGFWAIHLLSEHDIALQRASSRLPARTMLSVTRQAWADAGLDET
ncbi:MAG: hypothetical protein ACI9KE_005495, partial [Polyangiales bacterium]